MLIVLATFIALAAAASANDFCVVRNESLCETPACVHAASSILKNMDPSVDPCDNFYQFACGNFIKNTIIPPSDTEVDFFDKVRDKIQEQLHDTVSDEITEDDPPFVEKLKSYYQICMDTEEIEKNSVNDLKEVLKQLGGCPVLEGSSWDEASFDWKRTMFEYNKMGFIKMIFLETLVNYDPKNSTRHIIEIFQANPDVSREDLIEGLDNAMVQYLLNIQTTFAVFLGADPEQAIVELTETMKFLIEMAKISLPDHIFREASIVNNRMTVEELRSNHTSIDWNEYLNGILQPYAHIEETDDVIIIVPSYLKNLIELIERTPKRVVANHVCNSAIWSASDNMGIDFENIKARSRKAVYDMKEQPPRWQMCYDRLEMYFPTALGWLYIKNHFDKSAIPDATIIAQHIQDSLRQLIEKADWMGNETRLAALEKMDALTSYVGYIDELEEIGNVEQIYDNITLSSKSFLRADMELRLFVKQMDMALKDVSSNNKWMDHSYVTRPNAFYTMPTHTMDIPAGILQGQFFDARRPNYMNYGAIGWIIGHEMSHAFDDQGSQFDKNGNIVDWWKNETKLEYFKRLKCFIEQYSNYTVKEINRTVNGRETQAENISDHTGLKAAYLAYNEWTKEKGKESPLPGLQYTPQQMFWISAANMYCKKMRLKSAKVQIEDDPHAPREFRVIGTMSNIPEFSEDFKCPLGSTMNRVNKCSVW